MLKLESIEIQEIRGIRQLHVAFHKQPFAISGPNGTGKSGIIDAIEFALIGKITRLSGQGSKELSLAKHGPHIDAAHTPQSSFVKLAVFLTAINKSITVTRSLAAPNKPVIEPADADVLEEFAKIAEHPELAISRREILRCVTSESSKRSDEIQALLKLDAVGQLRASFFSAQNKLKRQNEQHTNELQMQKEHLSRHLQIPTLSQSAIVHAVNARRAVLAIPPLATLTKLDEGVTNSAATPAFNKESALRDLQAVATAITAFPQTTEIPVSNIVSGLRRLQSEPALLAAIQARSLLESGLNLIDGPNCPLCDTTWTNEQELREHLKQKLAKSAEAQSLRDSLLRSGAAVAREIAVIISTSAAAQQLAQHQNENSFVQQLALWKTGLDQLRSSLFTVEGLIEIQDQLPGDFLRVPIHLLLNLEHLTKKISDIPDQSAVFDAQTFLLAAQSRLEDYQHAKAISSYSASAFKNAKIAYQTFCDAMESELNALYSKVEQDFCEFYRILHSDDEANIKMTMADLKVDFYQRGLFPPSAYHSEGHQDSMGVCLYLALRKQQSGANFSFALLDDVLTSIDIGHRRQFCALLREKFPDTQFLITTHDKVWAEQMKSSGLVSEKTSLVLKNWNVDTGPVVASSPTVWEDIETALAKDKVPVAAALLRRHLEFVFRELAGNLGAKLQFRPHGDYELGALRNGVISRLGDLYSKALLAAQYWKDPDLKSTIEGRRKFLANVDSLLKAADSWTVNKLVHYNEWTNLGRNDFAPVVAGYKQILGGFACSDCHSWLFTTGRGEEPDSLRCACSAINLNLVAKQKTMTAGGK